MTEERLTGRPRRYVATLSAFGGAQALIAVSAIFRIPIILAAIGSAKFGAIFVVGAAIPLLMVSAAGIRVSTQTLVAERLGSGGPDLAHYSVASARKLASAIGIAQATLGAFLAATLPSESWFHVARELPTLEFRAAFAVTAVMCALTCPGAVWWGVLEAHERADIPNHLISLATLIGLAATAAAALLHAPFLVFATLNTATSTAPFFAAAYIGKRRYHELGGRWPRGGDPVVGRTTAIYSAYAVAEVASRGLDPFIIGGALGAVAVARYSIPQRLSIATTAVPLATAPLLTASYAHRRGRSAAITSRSLLQAIVAQVAVSIAVGAAFVVGGPLLGKALAPRVPGHFTLYVGFAILGVVWAMLIPLRSAATGPLGLKAGAVINSVAGALNVVLSVLLVTHFGLVGPVVGSIVATALAVVAWSVLIWRRKYVLAQVHPSRSDTPGSSSPLSAVTHGRDSST